VSPRSAHGKRRKGVPQLGGVRSGKTHRETASAGRDFLANFQCFMIQPRNSQPSLINSKMVDEDRIRFFVTRHSFYVTSCSMQSPKCFGFVVLLSSLSLYTRKHNYAKFRVFNYTFLGKLSSDRQKISPSAIIFDR
jgi:hypothetical protein